MALTWPLGMAAAADSADMLLGFSKNFNVRREMNGDGGDIC